MFKKYSILDEDIITFDTTNDSYKTLISYFANYLTKTEIDKIDSFKKEEDKILRIISYSLPKIELSKLVNEKPENIIVVRNDNERPYFKDYLEYKYSISHCYPYIAFVLSKSNVGIDVEKRVFKDLKALNYVSSINELKELTDDDSKYALWTFKEAYSKYIGTGITKELKKIHRNSNDFLDKTIYINHMIITLVKEK